VQQRALADTGKKAAAELTNQELALARVAIIMDQTNSAAGDFAQTSDGLANSTRIANAQIEDAQAKIGSMLLPALAKGAQIGGDFAETIGSLPGPLRATGAGIAVVAGAALLLGPRVMAVKSALDEMRGSESKATRGLGNFAASAAKVGSVAGIAFTAIEILRSGYEGLQPQVEAATGGLTDYAKGAELSGEAARLFGKNNDDLVESLKATEQGWAGWKQGAESVFTLGRAYDDSKERIKAFDDTLSAMVQAGNAELAANLFAQAAERSGKSIEDLQALLPEYTGAQESAARASREAGGAIDDTTGALDHQAETLDDVRRSWDQMNDMFFGAQEAQDAVTDATERLNDQIKEQIKNHEKGAGSFEGNTKAARENRAVLRDLFSRTQDLIQVEAEHGTSSKKTIAEFEKQARSMGIGKDKAHDYALALQSMADELARIKSKTVTVTVREVITKADTGKAGTHHDYAHGGITGAASGGARGGRTLVGEEGPEVVDMPFGSTVHPAGESRAMLAGSGSGVVYLAPLVIQGGGATQALMEDIAKVVDTQFGGDIYVAFRRR
jgi:hypothetical protein